MAESQISDQQILDIIARERPATPWAQIASNIGISLRRLQTRVARLRASGELSEPVMPPGQYHEIRRQRWTPLEQSAATVPAPFQIKGQTILRKVNEDGTVSNVMWYDKVDRTQVDWTQHVKEFVAGLCDEVRGQAPPRKSPAAVDADLCNIIAMGDPHVGLYAWAAEAGDNFDLDIAERHLVRAVERLVQQASRAAEAWLVSLGDFFHADDESNATPASKHALDVDSRWPKIQRAGGRIMRQLIDLLLTKHKRVVVRCVRGNHDPHASYTLAMLLDALYDREPRVEVSLDPAQHWYRSRGSSLYGVTHGHTVKRADVLPGLMATDVPHLWAGSRFRRWLLGHYHSSKVTADEVTGCSIEIFRTLAPTDAWAHGQGYRSLRSMDAITVHRSDGEIMRHRVFHHVLDEPKKARKRAA